MDLEQLSVPKPQAASNGDEVKAFTFRNIPSPLHKAWKTCAAITGISMEEFALTAIQTYITGVMGGGPSLPSTPTSSTS